MRVLWAIYDWLLWHMGFARDEQIVGQEHITDILQRQKERLGAWWFVWWIPMTIIAMLFPLWLVLHICGIPPFGKRKVTP